MLQHKGSIPTTCVQLISSVRCLF